MQIWVVLFKRRRLLNPVDTLLHSFTQNLKIVQSVKFRNSHVTTHEFKILTTCTFIY